MADVAAEAASPTTKRVLEEDAVDVEVRPVKKTRGPKKICACREEGANSSTYY